MPSFGLFASTESGGRFRGRACAVRRPDRLHTVSISTQIVVPDVPLVGTHIARPHRPLDPLVILTSRSGAVRGNARVVCDNRHQGAMALDVDVEIHLGAHVQSTWPDRRLRDLMLIVRGTKKLRDRMKQAPVATPADESTTSLGDWFATALSWIPQVALLVNTTTMLPVFTPLAPAGKLLGRVPEAIADVLREHGVPDEIVDAEVAAMGPPRHPRRPERPRTRRKAGVERRTHRP